jgi:hypothetical protein
LKFSHQNELADIGRMIITEASIIAAFSIGNARAHSLSRPRRHSGEVKHEFYFGAAEELRSRIARIAAARIAGRGSQESA